MAKKMTRKARARAERLKAKLTLKYQTNFSLTERYKAIKILLEPYFEMREKAFPISKKTYLAPLGGGLEIHSPMILRVVRGTTKLGTKRATQFGAKSFARILKNALDPVFEVEILDTGRMTIGEYEYWWISFRPYWKIPEKKEEENIEQIPS